MQLTVRYSIPPRQASVRASLVMDHFGISYDATPRTIAENLSIPVEAGDIVLFTGGSGSGKSSLLRVLAEQLAIQNTSPAPMIVLSQLDLGKQTLIDAIPLPMEEALQLLAMCGLGEAPLMLRTPHELSDGQRYRFALALAISKRPAWIVADEFAALLDRTTAQVIAHNVRRLSDRYDTGFLLATAQDDLETDLEADIHVRCELDGRLEIEIHRTEPVLLPTSSSTDQTSRKKKDCRSAFMMNSGSAPPPSPTGRISLGGIIGATTSG